LQGSKVGFLSPLFKIGVSKEASQFKSLNF
jgi:hypothetical protein